MQTFTETPMCTALLAVACFLSGCMIDPADDAAHTQQRALIHSEGIVLISDACIYRQSPPLQANYYLIGESIQAATAIQLNIAAQLSASGFKTAAREIPYICGSLYPDPPRRAWTAEHLDGKSAKAPTFPVVRLPVLLTDAALQKAYQQLMKRAAEAISAAAPTHRLHEPLSPAQAALLRRHFGAANLLISLGRGASVSIGMKTTDVVAGLLLAGQIGSGGCALSDRDCDLSDTAHDGFRVGAVLIDLDHPDLIWLGKSTDIVGHSGTFDQNDPLDPAIYRDPSWAPKLLKTFPGQFRQQ